MKDDEKIKENSRISRGYAAFGEITEDTIKVSRNIKIIHINSQLSMKSIIKFFDNIENFTREIINANQGS